MKITAVIAEFNPFHNGHRYILNECRARTHADAVLVLMSGDYVERGAPAIADGYFRAETALRNGADLVLFLPGRFVLRSAEGYAHAAVSLLDRLGCVDNLFFGSECGEIAPLLECARALSEESDARKEILRKNLKEGLSFPKARALAFPEYAGLLDTPNNILGIAYLKALRSLRSVIEPSTVPRVGPSHNDKNPGKEYASASAIRILLSEQFGRSAEEISRELPVPENGRQALLGYFTEHRPVTSDDFSGLLGIPLMELSSREELLSYPDVDADLAGTLFRNRFAYTGFTAYADRIKSKAYTMTRIHRVLLRIALDLREEGASVPLFARAAGFTDRGARLLAELRKKSAVPVLTQNSEREVLSRKAQDLYDEEVRISNIYRLIREAKSGRPPQNVLKNGLIRV